MAVSLKGLIVVKMLRREDGGLRIWSDGIGGLILSDNDPVRACGKIWPALLALASGGDLVDAKSESRPPMVDPVTIERADLIELKQLVGIVHDIAEAKQTLPLLGRICAALETN